MEEQNIAKEALSDLTVYMKYAKYVPELKRKESWLEICQRNMDMHLERFNYLGEDFAQEIEDVYADYVVPKKILPSMRSMHFAGKPIDISPNRIYNCAYMPINNTLCFSEAMFLLLGGTGVGYSVQRHHVEELPEIIQPNPNRKRKIVIEDSIKGWAEAVKELFRSYTGELSQTPRFIYDDIRPKGSLLKTSGGRAPGSAPLRKCLVIIESILSNKNNNSKLTTIEAHDILCHIADAVLSGGIRRAAMISLFSIDDMNMINSKAGQFWESNPQRARANNSAVILRHKIDKETFTDLWKRIEGTGTGEPGLYFTNDKDWGTNPCCEIALRPYQFCNLTECNVSNVEGQDDLNARVKAATFLGTLQASYTDFHYLRSIWKKTTEKDALLGVSMTGLASNKTSQLDITGSVQIAKEENKRVAKILGVNEAARLTCIKPSGTASCVLGTSSGIHAWHSPFYIRRIRVNNDEPIAMYLQANHPELMELDSFNPDGSCISIPQKAPINAITSKDEDVFSFLERVKDASLRWVRPGHENGQNTHNVSATVYINDGQWEEVGNWMWLNRHFYNGLSCFPFDEKAYPQPPFEACDEETYDKMMQSLNKLDLSNVIETNDSTDFGNNPACAGGACDI
tara:strand:- start:17706 stop:19586 length:1881 start_codon:yes stop_codon:yes gene_type:complete